MSNTDAIIAHIDYGRINDEPAQLIELHNGMIIALTANALACYRQRRCIHDPLGNGLLSLAEIAPDSAIGFFNGQCIQAHRSGFVGLRDGKALLISPFKVRLYPNNYDGLRGLNCLAELDLPEIDVY